MLVAPDCFRGLTEQEQRQQLYEALHGIVDHTGGEEPEPPEPEFDPSTIPGLILWAKAYDPITVTKPSDDAVSQWSDLSGNGNHLTQGTLAKRPLWRSNRINGLATITTDGIDDSLGTPNFGLVPPYEIYFLGKLTDEGATQQVFFDGIVAYGEFYCPSNGSVRMYASADFDTGAMVQANAVHVLSFNGASSFYRTNLNAILTGNPGTANPGGLIIGTDKDGNMQNSIIEICEILVYDNQLSGANRDAVCTYLMTKGNILPIPSMGLAAWFKSDAGVTKNGSNHVTQWADQSGNGNHLSTWSGTPLWEVTQINGYPTIHCGLGGRMHTANFGLGHDVEIFLVCNVTAVVDEGRIISGITIDPSNGVPWFGSNNFAPVNWHIDDATDSIDSGAVAAATGIALFHLSWCSSDAFIIRSGSTLATGTFTGPDPFGGLSLALVENDPASGDDAGAKHAEIIVYNGPVSAQDRVNAINYLTEKYNL